MNNFIVVAQLSTPVILTRGRLTLDSLLAAQIFRETESVEKAHADIPLAHTDGVWHGSAAFFLGGEGGHAFFGRSMKLDDLTGEVWKPLRGKYPYYVDQARNDAGSANQWRAMFNDYATSSADRVIWFGRGNMADVERLIKAMAESSGLGKKASNGYGRIEEVSLYPTDGDYSFLLPDGRPARPLPVDLWKTLQGGAQNASMSLETFRPPYFDNDQSAPCIVPEVRFLASNEWKAFRRVVS